eukprot:284819896_2
MPCLLSVTYGNVCFCPRARPSAGWNQFLCPFDSALFHATRNTFTSVFVQHFIMKTCYRYTNTPPVTNKCTGDFIIRRQRSPRPNRCSQLPEKKASELSPEMNATWDEVHSSLRTTIKGRRRKYRRRNSNPPTRCLTSNVRKISAYRGSQTKCHLHFVALRQGWLLLGKISLIIRLDWRRQKLKTIEIPSRLEKSEEVLAVLCAGKEPVSSASFVLLPVPNLRFSQASEMFVIISTSHPRTFLLYVVYMAAFFQRWTRPTGASQRYCIS